LQPHACNLMLPHAQELPLPMRINAASSYEQPAVMPKLAGSQQAVLGLASSGAGGVLAVVRRHGMGLQGERSGRQSMSNKRVVSATVHLMR
jgi:hypothetical protein